jgi:general secretion pathway protein I
MRTSRGYTLLEVLIAMAILAVALSILLGTQANSAIMTERANRMALASLLVRSKMIDIEGVLRAEGFQETQQEFSGDFGREGFEEMEWEAVVDILEIPDDASGDFAAAVHTQLFGDGENQGSLSGSDAVSQWLPMIMGELPAIINQMCERARRVTLTVTWPEGNNDEMSLTVEQYVVNLNYGGAEGAQPIAPMNTPPGLGPTGIQPGGGALQGQGMIQPIPGVTQ